MKILGGEGMRFHSGTSGRISFSSLSWNLYHQSSSLCHSYGLLLMSHALLFLLCVQYARIQFTDAPQSFHSFLLEVL